MSRVADVLVIGAGIVGAACARALAERGLSVHVIDARRGGATASGMGHLVVMDDNPAELELSRLSLEAWRRWGADMQRDGASGCDYMQCGTLWVAQDDAEMAAAEDKRERLQTHGIACELLGSEALAAREPLLRAGLAGALRVPGDAIVYAPNAAGWLLRDSNLPITQEHARVRRIEDRAVELEDGSTRRAGAVVLAAGMHSAELCPDLPLRPKKGQLAITDRYPGALHHQVVELGYVTSAHNHEGTSVAFNVQPRPTGQLLIGSSREFDNVRPEVDAALLARMLRRALRYAPALAQLQVLRTWTGIRPASPDGLPLIGAHPTRDGLWLAVGHEGLGVTTAPATAELLAALMAGDTLSFDPAPVAPGRFARGHRA